MASLYLIFFVLFVLFVDYAFFIMCLRNISYFIKPPPYNIRYKPLPSGVRLDKRNTSTPAKLKIGGCATLIHPAFANDISIYKYSINKQIGI